MSLIEEYYQDENGNWLPEAQEILAKAAATQTTNNGKHTLLPLDKDDDESNTAELSVGSNVCADEG